MEPVRGKVSVLQPVAILSPSQAFEQGTNVIALKRQNEPQLKAILIQGINELIKSVDANKTITAIDDIQFTVETIIEEFKTLNVEEILLVLSKMRAGFYTPNGNYYERLKAPEIITALKQYDTEERPEMLEQFNQRHKVEEMKITKEEPSENAQKYIDKLKAQFAENSELRKMELDAKIQEQLEKKKELKDRRESLDLESHQIEFKRICTKINAKDKLTELEKDFMHFYGIEL